jgi:hypothetical protein
MCFTFSKKFPPMKPSREEIESAIGGKMPDNAELEFGESEPKSSGGTKFDLVGIIKGKFTVWSKSVLGQFMGFYITLCGFGFPLPSLYEATSITMQQFIDVGHLVYEQATSPSPEPPDGWLVSVPTEFPLPPSGGPLSLDNLPTGSGGYPLSGSSFDHLRTELG